MKKIIYIALTILTVVLCLNGNLFASSVKTSLSNTGETTVTFRLIGDTKHSNGVEGHSHYVNWITTRTYRFDSDTVTVYDVFTRALNGAGLNYVGAEDNYVKTITAPITEGGYNLSEFTNGTNSGWMYTINGEHPNLGLKQQTVADGDVIVWHYVDDYILEAEKEAIYPNRWLEADDTESSYITANISVYELPAPDKITLGDADAITAARANYNNLNAAEKTYISVERLAKLVAAEARIATLKADEAGAKTVIDKIAALPAADKLTLADQAAVAAARAAYDQLSAGQQSMVTNYSTLITAEAKIAALAATPVTDVKNMKDIPGNVWYYDTVSFVLAKGIMKGTSLTSFDPDSSVTRGQFVTILGRYAGISDSGAANPAATEFKDVDATTYYGAHVAWAAQNGITTGTTATTFDPEAKISRQDMAVMLARFAKVMKIDLPDGSNAQAFGDDSMIADYAKTAVYSMVKANIIGGMGDSRFAPKENATRAQAAKMISFLIALAEK